MSKLQIDTASLGDACEELVGATPAPQGKLVLFFCVTLGVSAKVDSCLKDLLFVGDRKYRWCQGCLVFVFGGFRTWLVSLSDLMVEAPRGSSLCRLDVVWVMLSKTSTNAFQDSSLVWITVECDQGLNRRSEHTTAEERRSKSWSCGRNMKHVDTESKTMSGNIFSRSNDSLQLY